MKNTKLILFFLSIFLFLGSCSDDDKDDNTAQVVPISNYSLGQAPCEWDIEDGKLIVINSQNEMYEYYFCAEIGGGDPMPAIDFSKHSLLLVAGTTTSGISKLERSLTRVNNTYDFQIDVTLNAATVIGKWTVAVLAPKISKDAEIKLKVNQLGF